MHIYISGTIPLCFRVIIKIRVTWAQAQWQSVNWGGCWVTYNTLLRTVQCQSYKLFLSGIFQLIFLDHSWPWVTETAEGKTEGKGGLLYLGLVLLNFESFQHFEVQGNITRHTWASVYFSLPPHFQPGPPLLILYLYQLRRPSLTVWPATRSCLLHSYSSPQFLATSSNMIILNLCSALLLLDSHSNYLIFNIPVTEVFKHFLNIY